MAGLTFAQFSEDERTLYALVRCLEIISEASRRLSSDFKNRHAEVPWSQIAGAGNVFRHDYENVAPEMLWETVMSHLDRLDGAARAFSDPAP